MSRFVRSFKITSIVLGILSSYVAISGILIFALMNIMPILPAVVIYTIVSTFVLVYFVEGR